ncbi:MAG: flagellar protein FlaG [Proteobacteria bacterium]|nr:flagellar protein FlaG [Pseudomonadota bacterium]
MEYATIQLVAQDGYGKNFRIQKDAGAQLRPVAESNTEPRTAEAQSAAARPVDTLLKMTAPVERFMQSVGVTIKFHINEETEQIQAEVKSADGEKTIRKIPSDEIMKLAASIKELTDSEHLVSKTL